MTNSKPESTYCVACLMNLADQLLVNMICPSCSYSQTENPRLVFGFLEEYPLPVPICSGCARFGFQCDHCELAPVSLALESLMVAP